MTGHLPMAPSEAELLAAETAVWESLRAGDQAVDRRLLSPDFLGVYPTGFVTRDDHVAELDDATVAAETMLETRTMVTGEDSALIAYRVRFRVTEGAEPITWMVSSLGAWVILLAISGLLRDAHGVIRGPAHLDLTGHLAGLLPISPLAVSSGLMGPIAASPARHGRRASWPRSPARGSPSPDGPVPGAWHGRREGEGGFARLAPPRPPSVRR